jgi:Flp pilus assembly protein TadB
MLGLIDHPSHLAFSFYIYLVVGLAIWVAVIRWIFGFSRRRRLDREQRERTKALEEARDL